MRRSWSVSRDRWLSLARTAIRSMRPSESGQAAPCPQFYRYPSTIEAAISLYARRVSDFSTSRVAIRHSPVVRHGDELPAYTGEVLLMASLFTRGRPRPCAVRSRSAPRSISYPSACASAGILRGERVGHWRVLLTGDEVTRCSLPVWWWIVRQPGQRIDRVDVLKRVDNDPRRGLPVDALM